MSVDTGNNPSYRAPRAEVAIQTDDYGCTNGCLSIYVTMATMDSIQVRQKKNRKHFTDFIHRIEKSRSELACHKTNNQNPLDFALMQEYNTKNLIAQKQNSNSGHLMDENEEGMEMRTTLSNSKSVPPSNFDKQFAATIYHKQESDQNKLDCNSHEEVSLRRHAMEGNISSKELTKVVSHSVPLLQKQQSKHLVSTHKEEEGVVVDCWQYGNIEGGKGLMDSTKGIILSGNCSYVNTDKMNNFNGDNDDDDNGDIYNINDDDDDDKNEKNNHDDNDGNKNSINDDGNNGDDEINETTSNGMKYKEVFNEVSMGKEVKIATNNNNNIEKKDDLEVKYLEIFNEDSSATIELPQNAIRVNVIDGTNSQSLPCSICNVECLSKLHLEEHMTIAHEKPFQCETCEKRFKYQSSLTAHLKTHSGEDLYECKICNKSYTQRCHLSDHLRTHSGVKPFKCNICGKYFGQRSHLKGHIRTHTNERPYQCDICSKTFQFRSVLNQHLKIHSGAKPFSCPHCEKTFRQGSHLKVHLKIHLGLKPFECTLCGKKFREKTHLTLHNRSHTGERPYSCKICGKNFKSSSDVATHMKSHTNNKPLCCPHCFKRFSTQRGLRDHSRKHVVEKTVL